VLVGDVPWLSVASTVNVYAVEGESPVTANDVPVEVASGLPFIETV
jgi:hypothetical protein